MQYLLKDVTTPTDGDSTVLHHKGNINTLIQVAGNGASSFNVVIEGRINEQFSWATFATITDETPVNLVVPRHIRARLTAVTGSSGLSVGVQE